MNDASFVCATERLRQLIDDSCDLDGSQAMPVSQFLAEVVSFERLHDDVRDAIRRDAVVEHLHDVRALDLRSGRSFLREPGQTRRTRCGEQKLDDDLYLQALVLGEPDTAHPALSKWS